MRARKKLSSENAVLLTFDDVAKRYSVGLNTARKIAQDAGAVRHFGRTARVLAEVLDRYIMELEE